MQYDLVRVFNETPDKFEWEALVAALDNLNFSPPTAEPDADGKQ